MEAFRAPANGTAAGATRTGTADSPTAAAPRTIGRRATLPGGRAVVGGFLVAASAVGLFAAHRAATARHVPAYVVAAGAVAPGQRIAPADLDLEPIDLPPHQAEAAFRDPGRLVGAVAVAPLAEGDLVQASAVVPAPGATGRRAEISFPVEAARALGGALRPGERVDVVAAYGSGEAATAGTVATGALVVRVGAERTGIGSAGALTVVLAVLPAEVEELARAASAAQVSVVRTTGLGSS